MNEAAVINEPRSPVSPRYHPVEIAKDTWVIQATTGEGVAPQAVHLNAMVVRGTEPIVVDTGCSWNREQYLEDLFSIVEPEDVRWVFLSHDDLDHYGNLADVMRACPNATLIANWFMCERMGPELDDIAPFRWRWVSDGESFEAGDRTMLAVRPPLYDSPTTRGLFDTSTAVYWASDCYATPVERGTEFVDDLDPQGWAEGFVAFQHWNSPWLSMVDTDKFAAECRRIEELRPTAIATAHGPTIEATHVAQAFDLMRQVQAMPAPPQPGQIVLDDILTTMIRSMQ